MLLERFPHLSSASRLCAESHMRCRKRTWSRGGPNFPAVTSVGERESRVMLAKPAGTERIRQSCNAAPDASIGKCNAHLRWGCCLHKLSCLCMLTEASTSIVDEARHGNCLYSSQKCRRKIQEVAASRTVTTREHRWRGPPLQC
jgi:hypothetical protein